MGENLFWAIRGGGGDSFGIVIAWKVNLVTVPATVTVFTVTKTLEQNAIKLLHRWQFIGHNLPDGTFSFVSLRSVNSSQDGKRTVLASFSLFFLSGVDELDRTFQNPLIGPAFKAKSDYVKEPISDIALEGLWSKLYDEEAELIVILFVAYGGIMDEIPETATPFPHRAGNLYKILDNVSR
ncbi:hypothetical protein CRYUN_Cryun19dG0076800 [Craigia yunnanensis]